MSRRTDPKKPANLRSWRVIIMRSKGEHIGTVEAPDREMAEAVAIKQFDLDQDQRRRLLSGSGFNRALTCLRTLRLDAKRLAMTDAH